MSEKRYKAKDNFLVNHVAGEIVVVPVTDSVAKLDKMLVINDVGEFIINGVKNGLSTQAIVEKMSTEFEIPSFETAHNDLIEFADRLVENGFFERE